MRCLLRLMNSVPNIRRKDSLREQLATNQLVYNQDVKTFKGMPLFRNNFYDLLMNIYCRV